MITPFGRYSSVLILATATIAAYSLTGAAIRHVSESYGTHPFQIAFFRTLLTIVPLLLLLRLQSTPCCLDTIGLPIWCEVDLKPALR